MRESQIWRAVTLTVAVTAGVFLLVMLDPGFLSSYVGPGVIPISTGERIELLAVTVSPLRGPRTTELYWLKDDGPAEKVRSFDEVLQCVAPLDGALFVNFTDGSSSVVRDGQWERGVSPPRDFKIIDVAPLDGHIYAIGLGGQQEQAGTGSKIRIAVLEDGWKEVDPFDAAKQVFFAGSIEVSGGIEVLYGSGRSSIIGRPDVAKTRWYHVLFDGRNWSDEEPVELPEGFLPHIAAYQGRLALCLLPLDEEQPVALAAVTDGKVEIFGEAAAPEEGRILDAWLVELAGRHYAILSGAGTVWQMPLTDGKPGAARILMQVSPAARIRSHVYIAVLIVASVVLVSLGVTWLVMRIAAIGRRGRQ